MKRVCALDLGTKTVGFAVSDSLGIAHGREEFRFQEKAYRQAVKHVIEFLHAEKIDEVALGYPLNMDGSAGESAHRSERFKEELLEADPSLTITLVDERLTTVDAEGWLEEAGLDWKQRKAYIDQEAALAILERYLAQKEGK